MAWSAASAATAAMQTVATRRAATAAATPGGQVSVALMCISKKKHMDLNCDYLFSSRLERKKQFEFVRQHVQALSLLVFVRVYQIFNLSSPLSVLSVGIEVVFAHAGTTLFFFSFHPVWRLHSV